MSVDPSSAEMEVGVLREEVRRLNDIIEHLNREWGPQVARLEREVEGYTTLIQNINLLGGLERERLEQRIQILQTALVEHHRADDTHLVGDRCPICAELIEHGSV